MSGFLDSVKSAFTSSTASAAEAVAQDTTDESDQSSFFGNARKKLGLPKLTLKQRVIGFVICLSIAGIFALLGCLLVLASKAVFAVLFTISTIAALVSTFFLVGPIDQVIKMWDPKNPIGMVVKIVCAVTLVLSFVLAMCAVFWWDVGLLSLLFCLIEFVALIIYAITLIPFATTLINRGVRSMMNE